MLGAGTARAQAPTFTFSSLASTSTPVPGRGGNFGGFDAVSLSNGVAVFTGNDGGSYNGVFTSSVASGVSRIIDTSNSPTGAGHGTFINFATPTISDGNVAFSATFNSDSGSGYGGVYTASTSNPGVATTLAERGQTTPSGTATYTVNIRTPAISGNNVVFFSNISSGGSGYFQGMVGSSTVTTLADRSTPAPGQGGVKFTNFNFYPTISGSTSAFYGRSSTGAQGIYTSDPVFGLRTVLDTTSAVPGHSGTTFSAIAPGTTGVISGNNVAFHAYFSGGEGYYLGSAGGNGAALKMVELGDAAPRGGTFTGFGSNPAISGTSVLFDAVTNNNGVSTVGLFLNYGGTVTEVINNGDTLFGGTLSSFGFTPTAFDGNQIAFNYSLTNGEQGVALVSFTAVPEPATWLMSALLMGAAICIRRRRRVA